MNGGGGGTGTNIFLQLEVCSIACGLTVFYTWPSTFSHHFRGCRRSGDIRFSSSFAASVLHLGLPRQPVFLLKHCNEEAATVLKVRQDSRAVEGSNRNYVSFICREKGATR